MSKIGTFALEISDMLEAGKSCLDIGLKKMMKHSGSVGAISDVLSIDSI